MSLKILQKEIKTYQNRKQRERREETQERRKKQASERRYAKSEKSLLPEKRKLCKYILSWVDNFTKSKEFNKIFKDLDGLGLNDLVIYYGDWGHNRPSRKDRGCWSRMCLEASGQLKYWAGYKWMPGPEFALNNETITKLSFQYLKELHKHISTGEVYRTIARELTED